MRQPSYRHRARRPQPTPAARSRSSAAVARIEPRRRAWATETAGHVETQELERAVAVLNRLRGQGVVHLPLACLDHPGAADDLLSALPPPAQDTFGTCDASLLAQIDPPAAGPALGQGTVAR